MYIRLHELTYAGKATLCISALGSNKFKTTSVEIHVWGTSQVSSTFAVHLRRLHAWRAAKCRFVGSNYCPQSHLG